MTSPATPAHDCAVESCAGFTEEGPPCGGCCRCLGGCAHDGPPDGLFDRLVARLHDRAGCRACEFTDGDPVGSCMARRGAVETVEKLVPELLDALDTADAREELAKLRDRFGKPYAQWRVTVTRGHRVEVAVCDDPNRVFEHVGRGYIIGADVRVERRDVFLVGDDWVDVDVREITDPTIL